MDTLAKPQVNLPLAASVLAASYRLTVVVNIVRHGLEGWRWIVDWRKTIRQAVGDIIAEVDPLNPPRTFPVVMTAMMDIHRGLSTDLMAFATQGGLGQDNALRNGLLDHLTGSCQQLFRAIASPSIPNPSTPPLDVCFRLGEDFAIRDLKSVDSYGIGDKSLFTSTLDNDPEPFAEMEFPDSVFPKTISCVDRDKIKCLFIRRNEYVDNKPAFTIGAWFYFFSALMNPGRNPALLWIPPSPDPSGRTSLLVVLGKHLPNPALIAVKKNNDQALLRLVSSMKRDRVKGLPPADCGWEQCRGGLWDSRERATLASAKNKLTGLAAPLGVLEYIDARQRGNPRGGMLRLPEFWATSEAVIRMR